MCSSLDFPPLVELELLERTAVPPAHWGDRDRSWLAPEVNVFKLEGRMGTSLLHVPDDKLELSTFPSSQLSLLGSSCA